MLQSKTTTCEDFFIPFLRLIVTNVLFCFSELRYNNGSKGCTVDLLSKNASNNSTIKFTAGVRNIKGGLSKCLDDDHNLDGSYNNT